MDIDGFWALIQRTKQYPGDRPERLAYLRRELLALPSSHAARFQAFLNLHCGGADTWDLWGAAVRISGGWCSDDGFEYFRLWLISLGRDVFERATADPDSLSDVPEIRRLAGRHAREWTEDERPEWEGLDYVAGEAFGEVEGIDDEDECDEAFEEAVDVAELDGEPSLPLSRGDRWDARDETESARRLPNLTAMFPLTTLD